MRDSHSWVLLDGLERASVHDFCRLRDQPIRLSVDLVAQLSDQIVVVHRLCSSLILFCGFNYDNIFYSVSLGDL